MTVRSTTREHDKQGENKERVIGSPIDQRTSAYSADNDDTRKEPTKGTHEAERVGTRRHAGRGDGRTKAESTNTDDGEAKYLSERVHGAERGTRHAMWPRKGRVTSTGMTEDEVRRRIVPNRGSGRGKTSMGTEHAVRYPTNGREERGSSRRPRAENPGSQGEVCKDQI